MSSHHCYMFSSVSRWIYFCTFNMEVLSMFERFMKAISMFESIIFLFEGSFQDFVTYWKRLYRVLPSTTLFNTSAYLQIKIQMLIWEVRNIKSSKNKMVCKSWEDLRQFLFRVQHNVEPETRRRKKSNSFNQHLLDSTFFSLGENLILMWKLFSWILYCVRS